MQCENCNIKLEILYGSGRFCSAKCARGYSTKSKRNEINEKVSISLRGKSTANPFRKGFDIRREKAHAIDSAAKRWKTIDKQKGRLLEDGSLNIEAVGSKRRRRLILEEQGRKCQMCGLGEIWNGKALSLQLDHIDGNDMNNARSNLRILCPNCHTQTPTYGSRNITVVQSDKTHACEA